MTGICVRRAALLLAGLASLWALAVALTGGFVLPTPVRPISSHDAARSLAVAVAMAAFYAAKFRRHWRADIGLLTHMRRPQAAGWICTATALIIGVIWGTFMGTGPDASGYVSEADMYAHGALTVPAPEWSKEATWKNGVWSAAPVGYRPTQKRTEWAPTYSPGLPLMMAVFEKIGGRDAVFYVVPLLGALTVWASYMLGRQLGGASAGAIAAVLMVCSPIFLWFLVQPMSDVPVAACWAAALVFAAARPSIRNATITGIAAAAAILVRPNLVPLALIPALLLATTAEARTRRLLLLAVPAAAAALVIATLNWYWYGSPFESGYGTIAMLYSPGFVWRNLRHFGEWLVDTQTPLFFFGFAAPFVLSSATRPPRQVVLLTVVYPLAVLALYVAYLPFDGWWYLRFLLPAFPAMLAGLGTVLAEVVRRSRRPAIAIVAVAALTASVTFQEWKYAHREGVFRYASNDDRFARAVDFANTLPLDTILVSLAYSGTLRFYTGRDVLRWELLNGDELDGAVEYLRSRGHPLCLIGDPYEAIDFKRRFATTRIVKDDFDRRQLLPPHAVFVAYDLSAGN